MSTLRDDIRATAESIAVDAARLAAVEREKGARHDEDPAIAHLNDEAEALSESIGRKVAAERDLVRRMERGPRGV